MPRLLDLFCCEGGAGFGYHQAGFDVVGVDIEPQRRYPFEFVQADAIAYVTEHWQEFDAIHASPPCQAYSITKHAHGKEHPELIEPTRTALVATGLPYVIENVVGAPLWFPLTLCGTEFGLRAWDPAIDAPVELRRHRLFESNRFLYGAGGCMHSDVQVGGVYSGGSSDRAHAKGVRHGGYTPSKAVRQALIGADWMTLHGLSQSIPPAYTRFVGEQLIQAIEVAA